MTDKLGFDPDADGFRLGKLGRLDGAAVKQVIAVETLKGDGVGGGSIARRVVYYYDLDGTFLAKADEWDEDHEKFKELKKFLDEKVLAAYPEIAKDWHIELEGPEETYNRLVQQQVTAGRYFPPPAAPTRKPFRVRDWDLAARKKAKRRKGRRKR